jgi:hypothetical protein
LDLTSSVLSGGERGLLGLALAPDYATSGRFFVNFTNKSGDTVVARFRRSTNPLVADPASRFDLLFDVDRRYVAQPFSNHNGGHLAFGPTAISTSGWATAGPGTIRIIARRTQTNCSARCCASTSPSPTPIQWVTESRQTTRLSAGTRHAMKFGRSA